MTSYFSSGTRAEIVQPEPSGRSGRVTSGGQRATSRTPRRWLADHPEWLVLTISAAAWCWLYVLLAGGAMSHGHHDEHAGHVHHPSFDSAMLIWVAMVIAMMLPTTIPHVRYVGFGTRATRTQRSILLFALGYLTVWLVPGLVVAAIPGPASPIAVGLAALGAGAWELTPIKRRALLRCCRTWPVRYAGAAADASAVEYGVRHALGCLVISGPAMIVLMLAGHPWWATIALAMLMTAQKLLTRPQRWSVVVALAWAAIAVAVGVSAAVG